MSDFVSMQSIKLKNKLMDPRVLCAVRDGNLTMQDLQDVHSPLKEIYKNTYKYSEYPTSFTPSVINMMDTFTSVDEMRKKRE